MATNAKIELRLWLSDNTDYNPAQIKAVETDTFTTDGGDLWYEDVPVPIGPSNITVSINGASTNAKGMMIHNKDDSNFVTVAFNDIGGNSCSIDVEAGRVLVVPGCKNDADITFTADTAACDCDIWVGMV